MNARTVVLYSDRNDPVALKALDKASAEIACIYVDQLIPLLARQDWPKVLDMTTTADIEAVFSGAKIINRAFTLSDTELSSCLSAWGVDERWFHIRLQDLLKLGRSVSYDTGVRGVSRSLLPLNAQWFEMRRSLPDLLTPAFEYGFGYEHPDISALASPLQKSVWSLFDWKVERQLSPDEAKRHQFFVEAPRGVPLIAYFAGDALEVLWPRERVGVDLGQVREVVGAARRVFCAEAGEVLLYAEDQALRFYAFSPHLLSVAEEPTFQVMLSNWLLPPHFDAVRSLADAAPRIIH
ncbi:hypothetical protein [Xanthomonas albilineans]|uniref:hypothetical protein n=1 Tax=Xanthomonas albilineans TaxID=29447 RepID=UPI0005F35056|nr:hypothetical protein [Xanthomonas albilineans]